MVNCKVRVDGEGQEWKYIGWIPVAVVLLFISYGSFVFLVPFCMYTVEDVIERACLLTAWALVVFMFLWSFGAAVIRPVSRPPSKYRVTESIHEKIVELTVHPNVEEWQVQRKNDILEDFVTERGLGIITRVYPGMINYCLVCKIVKPDRGLFHEAAVLASLRRCHHCSFCGHCVLRFDHHCPWINSCVNHNNYKSFILFLLYATLVSTYGFLCGAKTLIEAFKRQEVDINWVFVNIVIGVILTFIYGLLSGFLTLLHLYLLAKNKTTIDDYLRLKFTNDEIKDFNLGCRKNFTHVFGKKCYLWLLPVQTTQEDGMNFEVGRKN